MKQTPTTLYKEKIASGELHADPVQAHAVASLERLYDDLVVHAEKPKPSFFKRLTGGNSSPDISGIYMHGGVGRGKSMLMDLFYDALPNNVSKRRVHFHEFMIEVHAYIHSRSVEGASGGRVDQALPSLAALIASKSQVLCFDEFHVVDITDAMILGRLFKILFEHGLIVVATSNWAPDELYKDGLQRDRFLPFIALLKTKVEAIHLDSPYDYRKLGDNIEGTYFTPLNGATRTTMGRLFENITDGNAADEEMFEVKGREIIVREAVGGVGRFTFADLCEQALGAEDYLEIARRYHTVFLEEIPKLTYDRRNEAKRLMHLIDALYEGRVRVFISAAVDVDALYGGDDHAYEFERTVSRLIEMQSDGYP